MTTTNVRRLPSALLFSLFLLLSSCDSGQGTLLEPDLPNASPQALDASMRKNDSPASITVLEPGFVAELVVSGLNTPEGLDFKGAGVFFVVDSRGSQLLKILPNGNVSTFVDLQAGRLIDVVIDPGRGLFVSDLDQGDIALVTMNGSVSTFTSGLRFPSFMALNAKGELFASEFGSGSVGDRVSKFSSDGTRTTVVTYDDTVNENPDGLAFDSQGALYVVEQLTGILRKFALTESTPLPIDATTVPPLVTGLTLPIDLAFDRSGDLFVVGSSDIYRIAPSGAVTTLATGLVGPFNGIDVNARGEIVVCDYGAGEVIKLSRTP